MEETFVSPRDLALMKRYPQIFGTGPWPVNETMLGWGLTIGDGWMPLLEQLCADLSTIIAEDRLAEFRVLQVKEKLGGLRFYARNGSVRTGALIAAAASESLQICEECGAPSGVRVHGGWYTTMCDNCLDRPSQTSGK